MDAVGPDNCPNYTARRPQHIQRVLLLHPPTAAVQHNPGTHRQAARLLLGPRREYRPA